MGRSVIGGECERFELLLKMGVGEANTGTFVLEHWTTVTRGTSLVCPHVNIDDDDVREYSYM